MRCPREAKCKDRTVTCHTSCEKYKIYREKLDKLRERNRRSLPIRIPMRP